MTPEQKANVVERLLAILRDELPLVWTEQQVTEFFLAAGVGHAHSTGSHTAAQMLEYVESVAGKGPPAWLQRLAAAQPEKKT